jgi:5'-nucleotidase/UDP-sugar diphosphatase
MKKCSFSIFILFLLVLTACQKENNFTVAILHTNDVHGKIDNFGKLTYLKDSLLNHYDTVLLVSAGDIFSGNPYVDYHEQRGYPMIELMNQSGYDLAVLGNHEFDYGQDVLAERIEQAAFSISGCKHRYQ